MIIGVLNQKGGVGKTTLAVKHCGQPRQGWPAGDAGGADPQGSALAWSQRP